ncbi:hypothetical protein AB0M41_11415 [Streptomyces sp. NPDC051896]|uniref:hypothetical protein n=1 Tax=Streptomyces sp. NPDC051896 TaxID=3155416 RepID=UPI003425F514
MTDANHGTGDERWDQFVREFETTRAIHEPSAAERQAAAEREAAGKRPRRRKAMTVTAVAGAVAVLAGAAFWLSAGHGPRHETAGRTAGPASAAPSQRSARPESPAEPSTAPMSMVTVDQAFPARVAGYTKVKQSGGPNCTGSGMVGPNLTALIEGSKGCRGVIGALYKDASNNEYTIVAFGMKDPVDVVHMVTALSTHPTDYEVGVLTPPAGSGLRALPADSGLVQSFAGYGRLLVVGLGQWSDGRTADYQALVDKLSPLMNKVTKVAGGHDRG